MIDFRDPSAVPTLTPGFRMEWTLGSDGWEADGAVRQNRFLKALWAISQQTIASVSVKSDRSTRRDARRHGLPDDGTRVITLRHPRRPTSEDQRVRDVDWSRRWIVSGHWRNQYLPGSGTHRQQWIAAHLKCPDDKPLVVRDEVTFLRR